MIEQIIKKIQETTKERMDLWEENFFNHVKNLEKYCSRDVYKEIEERGLKRDAWSVHGLKVKRGWTRTMEMFFGRSNDSLKAMIHKEAVKKIAKIEFAVKKKINEDVSSIELIRFNPNGKDGNGEGAWRINNKKIFSFETIYAGGHSVQCFHVRTIYRYK